jgi:hypothetical protein
VGEHCQWSWWWVCWTCWTLQQGGADQIPAEVPALSLSPLLLLVLACLLLQLLLQHPVPPLLDATSVELEVMHESEGALVRPPVGGQQGVLLGQHHHWSLAIQGSGLQTMS